PLSTTPSTTSTFQSNDNVGESNHNRNEQFSSMFSVIRAKTRIRRDSRVRIGLTFLLLSFTIYLLHLLSPGEYLKVEESRGKSNVTVEEVESLPTRPYEGYVLDINRVNKHCEPIDQGKSSLKHFKVQDCLDYLDTQQHDYMVKPAITPNAANTSISALNLQCAPGRETMLFHVYWRGRIIDKLAINIKSFLYTQPLKCSKMIVWLDENNEDLENNKYVKSVLQFSPENLEFRKWNITEQLNYDTIYSGWERKFKSKIRVVGYSDMVRFVLLHRYGGMYVDADTLFLRDLSPLYYLDYDFSYRWSFWLNYNTAILRLRKNSTLTRKIIKGAMKHSMKFHPYSIKKYLISNKKGWNKANLDEQLYMMPVVLFDPLWLKSDLHDKSQILRPNLGRWKDVFLGKLVDNEFPGVDEQLLAEAGNNTKLLRKKEEFFRGAFTYHWHNRWKQNVAKGSWFDILQKAYDDFIQGKISNLYNEWNPNLA
ncbi:14517_t:CDS:1, partial [Acaulospora morrowiae]